MLVTRLNIIILVLFGFLAACEKEEPAGGTLQLQQVFAGSSEIDLESTVSSGIPVDASIVLVFSGPVNKTTASSAIQLKQGNDVVATNISFQSQDKSVVIYPNGVLQNNTVYTLSITDQLTGASGETFEPRELSFRTKAGALTVTALTIDGRSVSSASRISNVPADLKMAVNFSVPVNPASFEDALSITGPGSAGLQVTYSNDQKTAEVTTTAPLQYLTKYEFSISNQLQGTGGEGFSGISKTLYTQLDSTYKFPEISDEALLTRVQEQTFRYFWDFAHPTSGLARERNTSGNTVTIGGSGFGVMTILVGIERGFISRQAGVDRLQKIVNFLETADRFHGVWPHWIDGNTGDVVPFSTKDNGGDLVETAFMIQGLLAAREYLNPANPQEAQIIQTINQLWEAVEWDWYTKEGENVLYWHWSPDYGWEMNHRIQGWNEALIVYVLAAASPTHPIDPAVYHEGWARGGNMQNGNSYYGINLPLGEAFGGPLFFAHYSFLGLDPRNLRDQYANYWEQNVNHSLINQQHAVANPQNWVGYGEKAWGFTASDNQEGYSAHSPTNDKGVITPTAALSSMPYTPDASMDALKHFYYLMGDRIWGEYGFKDAYNPTAQWYADSYLAIDQGPIIIMIENHRSALLWDLFMSAPEVKAGLEKLGFSYE
ncbi:glucoamylase family protein [Cesiribacter sp. SM1]|uniref:glucoamylase family protein n=1 Tax=Cesiribacter sp. SM1 TaxID=2861196 RepID=UPI001CD1AD9B|nr:glucoamylase family protein [Cesiribacter sp. SM1]